MENFTAYLEYTDAQIGRVVDAVAASGELDNTLIIYIVGDNGASAEGGLEGTVNGIASLNGIQLGLPGLLAKYDQIGGPRRSRTRPSAGRGRRIRPSSGASKSPRTSAARAIRSSSHGRTASRTPVDSARNSIMSSILRPPSWRRPTWPSRWK
jgi:arylsulfatase A-like enzyme